MIASNGIFIITKHIEKPSRNNFHLRNFFLELVEMVIGTFSIKAMDPAKGRRYGKFFLINFWGGEEEILWKSRVGAWISSIKF